MKRIIFSLIVVVSLVWLVGCDNASRNFNAYADLNGDGKPEIIFGSYERSFWHYPNYNLVAKFSNEAQAEPRLIQRFKIRPDQIDFTDIDNDGDLDLVFIVCESSRRGSHVHKTYVAKNDGSGSFGSPELINRQEN